MGGCARKLARLSSPGVCGECFHRPSPDQALLEAVPIGVILLVWVIVDAILLLVVQLIVVDQWFWRQRASGLIAEAERLTGAAFE